MTTNLHHSILTSILRQVFNTAETSIEDPFSRIVDAERQFAKLLLVSGSWRNLILTTTFYFGDDRMMGWRWVEGLGFVAVTRGSS